MKNDSLTTITDVYAATWIFTGGGPANGADIVDIRSIGSLASEADLVTAVTSADTSAMEDFIFYSFFTSAWVVNGAADIGRLVMFSKGVDIGSAEYASAAIPEPARLLLIALASLAAVAAARRLI